MTKMGDTVEENFPMHEPIQTVAATKGIVILFDPPSYHYHKNQFFNLDSALNRDNTLRPNNELKRRLESFGYPVFTADMLDEIRPLYEGCRFHYWGFGVPVSRALAFACDNLEKIGAALFEPPLVKPADYRDLKSLTKIFSKVFLHNSVGDGYELSDDVDTSKIEKLIWTNRNYTNADASAAPAKRLKKFSMIAGAHFQKARPENGYGKRLEAIECLAPKSALDLYGFGWQRVQIRALFGSLFWRFKLWRYGLDVCSPTSKNDVYRHYDFALCFENMPMTGYITEKLFDALFAGCIPVYWGASDIAHYVPQDCYINLDDFPDMQACFDHCLGLSAAEKNAYRTAISRFLVSSEFSIFHNGFHGQIATFYGAD
ncbi:glycosyltransferase family 10 [Alphaproteobacteria bacterium]|nr:glycosyltransferase family 10 [Alphaproteobacteria bacterium]